jgi:putative nucleotidyltransferase with HDIG domain
LRPVTRAFIFYKYVILLSGFAVVCGAAAHSSADVAQHLPEIAVFFAMILVGELMPVRCPGTDTDVTMTIPAVISLFLSHGANPALAMASAAIFVGGILTHRGRSLRGLLDLSSYNTALCVIPLAVAFWLYHLVGGRTLQDSSNVTISTMVVPLFVAVTASTSVNVLTLTLGVAIDQRRPWRLIFAQAIRWFAPNYIITAPSGILFAYLYIQFGVYGVLLLLIPFILGRQALNMYSLQTDTYRETVTTLGSYMQHYHPYTKGHLERVADLSDRIARHMALSYQSLMFIREAGLLHDIGKVGVNEEILDKVGQLSDEDWATIKQHPARGAEILAEMKFLERIVPWVRGHHERPDGKGYPDGLTTDDIALEAAVIAVADAFDAMTGGPDERDRRVYRAPLTIDQGIDQLRYGAGTQFDTRVVRAFMQVMAREEVTNGS